MEADLLELGDQALLGVENGRVVVRPVELDEDLAGLDAVAEVVEDPEHAASPLGADGDFFPAL